MRIAINELRKKVVATLQKNFTKAEADRVADYLLWADMSGIRTQGIIKMAGTEPLQDIKPKHEIRTERDTKLSQLINAGAYPAPLVSQQATDVVIKKAKEHGFAIVGVHNTFSSNGAQSYYAERIAKENLIGIVMARSPGILMLLMSVFLRDFFTTLINSEQLALNFSVSTSRFGSIAINVLPHSLSKSLQSQYAEAASGPAIISTTMLIPELLYEWSKGISAPFIASSGELVGSPS